MGADKKHEVHRLLFHMMMMLLFAFFIVCPVLKVAAEPQNDIKIVRVGYYIVPGFQECNDETGEYSGISYEYMMALKQYTNWEYEFIPVEFSDGIRMLENGELDLMNNVSKTPEREEKLGFSTYASGSNYGCLIVNSDNTKYAYNDYKSFAHMRVGLLTDSIFNSYFKDYCRQHDISPECLYYQTSSQASEAMKRGDIDARIVSSSYHMNVRVVAKFAPMDYYFAVPKGDDEMLSELNIAMEQIKTDIPQLESNLEARYSDDYVEQNVVTTKEEEKFLEKNRTVKVAVSDSWYPISYFDNFGVYSGPLAQIYAKIAEKTGIHFVFVKYPGYAEVLESLYRGEADIAAEFPNDFSFADQWNVSLTNMVSQVSVYRITSEKYYAGKIKRIALFENPYLDRQIKKLYGNDVTYIEVADAKEAVEAVRTGKVDCTYLNYYQAMDFQNQGKYLAMKYLLMPSLQYDFCIGIADCADPALKSLIEKGLWTISEDEKAALFQETAEHTKVPGIDMLFYQNPVIIVIAVSTLAGIAVLMVANYFYYRRIQAKNQELERASRAKTDFLSNMSHEIRTPMNAIIGITKLAEKENIGNSVVTDYLKKIDESSQYLLSILNDVLDMSRIESDRFMLNKVWVSPKEITVPCLDMIVPMMEKKKISFVYDHQMAEDTFYEYYVDIMKTQQLLMNLLNNAYKFTAEGGHVSFHFQNLSIDRETQTAIDQFIITDDGCGMSEEFLKKIFTPFEQERNNYTGPVQGTGLGLALSKSIIQQMGGDITVISKLGEGSEFTVTFPYRYRMVKEKRTEEIQKEQKKEDTALSGTRMLLAEDHPLNAMIVTRLLEARGIFVVHVENGQEALNAFQDSDVNTFAAILMDIRMPLMDGIEACKAIRACDRPDATAIPIIAMTANVFEEDIQNCLDAGMDAHLSKPIDPDLMYQVLEHWVIQK